MRLNHVVVCASVLAVLASCSGPRPSPSPTEAPTIAPTESPPPPALPPATETPSLVTPQPTQASLIRQVLASPDGEWNAEASFEFLDGGASFRVRLVVRKIDGSVEWTPVDYTQTGIGYSYPALRWWAPDSRTFYYFNMATPDGCGDFYPIEDEWIALDVADGSQAPFPLPEGRGHTVSPDGETMIYASTSSPYRLVFRDLGTGTERLLPLPPPDNQNQEVQAGGAVWSPDGLSFALSVAYGDSCAELPLRFSVLRVDRLSDPSFLPLVKGSRRLLRLIRWDPSGPILVKDWDDYSWWIDSLTGEPVPAPAP
ncbi:MAG TPA: hypothetical protein VLD63_07695 [Anaerolineales bacterium]|nr:hypothetical protein [Anaerolineales bacterium]